MNNRTIYFLYLFSFITFFSENLRGKKWIVSIPENKRELANFYKEKKLFLPRKHEEVLKVLSLVVPKDPVIFEAGAFDGTDTIRMLKNWPQSTIYSFEPVPQNFARLELAVKDYNQIKIYPIALSDNDGFAKFYFSEHLTKPFQSSQSGSLLKPKKHIEYDSGTIFPYELNVTTRKIDTWAKENNISNIDFMWLDMQGNELTALKNAGALLSTVKVIFLEVEFVEAYEGQPLYNETRSWLEKNGFFALAQDFDETHAQKGNSIKRGENWFGNILLINNSYRNAILGE